MNISKKEIIFLSITIVTLFGSIFFSFSLDPIPFYPTGNVGNSVLQVLSGYTSLVVIYLTSIGFLGRDLFSIVLLFLPFATMAVILFFTQDLFIGKRIAYSYFISMYLFAMIINFVAIF